MKSFQDNHIRNLPDVYRKDTDSNNYKILEIEKSAVDDFRQSLSDIDNILNIDNAYGKTLDLYGERVGQTRGVATDEQYKVMIKSKIMQNLSNGTHKSVMDSICMTLGCEPSDIEIADSEYPCRVNVNVLSLDTIIKSGFSASQVFTLIKRLLPVGVGLETLLFEGTFEFSDNENDYDENAGFCDVEGGTIGGTLGITEGDENNTILPI